MKSYGANFNKIMEVLLKNPHYLTLGFIAESIGLSKRSVQNYLVDIDRWLIQNRLCSTRIIRKQGHGVMLEAGAMDRLKIDDLLSGKSLSINSDDNIGKLFKCNRRRYLQQ